MENIIKVKNVQEKSKDGGTWLELVDQDQRTHRIFRKVQDNEGNWHDLSSKYEMIRNSENRSLKLITEQKGRFTNVIEVEPSCEAAGSKAPRGKPSEDEEYACRLRAFTTSYAKDLAIAGKIGMEDMLGWSELFFRYLWGEVEVSDEEIDRVRQKSRGMERPGAVKNELKTIGLAMPAKAVGVV